MNDDYDKLKKYRYLLILATLKDVFTEQQEIRKHFTSIAQNKKDALIHGATHINSHAGTTKSMPKSKQISLE